MRLPVLAWSLLLSSAAAFAADTPPAGDVPAPQTKAETPKPDPDVAAASVVESASPQRRSIPFRGGKLSYTVTPGTLTIRDDDGAPKASMFYTAYTMEQRGKPRPVTFLFNGGPGSSTMWLHMGSFGPIKIDTATPETIAGPPFRMAPIPTPCSTSPIWSSSTHRRRACRAPSARPRPRIFSGSTRMSMRSAERSSAT